MTDPITNFELAINAAGIYPVEDITNRLASGSLIRFQAEGDKPGRRNGWAVLYLNDQPAGAFGHHRLGIRETWRGECNRCAVSPRERRAIRAKARKAVSKRTAETRAKQESAAEYAKEIWKRADRADPTHGYLVGKNLEPFGIRQDCSTLLIPMFDASCRLWNFQRIASDGTKLFLRGGRTEALFWPHATHLANGQPSPGPLVIGEGYSTAAAIHMATGYGVVAAMSARNLEAVARAMRRIFPSRQIIVAADDDRHLDENVGLSAATRAAQVIGGLLAVPVPENHESDAGIDFADIARSDVAARLASARPVRA